MRPWRAGALTVLGLLASRAEAAADTAPSAWDLARDPDERGRWKLHAMVEGLLHPVASSDDVSSLEEDRTYQLSLERARAILEDADAAHSPDVRLAFDLGIVYERLAHLQGDDVLEQEKAVAVLTPALAASPDHPAAADALYALATALAYLDRPREELAAWRRYIPKLADDERRLLPMTNMGEAEMRLGQVDAALATFRSALDLCESLPNSASLSEPYALILWDVAIALDRQGDPVDALRMAGKARNFSWTVSAATGLAPGVITFTQTGWDAIQDYVDVFFVPAWERNWYLALGEAAAATDATDPRVAANAWGQAEGDWGTYFAKATASAGDGKGERATLLSRWAAMAKLRRDYAHRERLGAEKRAAALPPAARGARDATP
jgi:tetratricopeptide (TPR) repeat protein